MQIDAGGSVTNDAGGTITGTAEGVYIGGGLGMVVNSGTISGGSQPSVYLAAGGCGDQRGGRHHFRLDLVRR